MESIILFIMSLWYKLPKVKFINPIKLSKCDSRALEWFKERRQYGFDETELWNLSGNLSSKIEKLLGLQPESIIDLNNFIKWINSKESKNHIIWFIMRLNKYIEWNCPLFFIDECYLTLELEEQKEIALKVKTILENISNERLVSDKDIEFLHKHIFGFGW